jgi:hypothetical protein
MENATKEPEKKVLGFHMVFNFGGLNFQCTKLPIENTVMKVGI